MSEILKEDGFGILREDGEPILLESTRELEPETNRSGQFASRAFTTPQSFRGVLNIACPVTAAERTDGGKTLTLALERSLNGTDWEFVSGLTWQGHSHPSPKTAPRLAARGPVLQRTSWRRTPSGEENLFDGYQLRVVVTAPSGLTYSVDIEEEPQ